MEPINPNHSLDDVEVNSSQGQKLNTTIPRTTVVTIGILLLSVVLGVVFLAVRMDLLPLSNRESNLIAPVDEETSQLTIGEKEKYLEAIAVTFDSLSTATEIAPDEAENREIYHTYFEYEYVITINDLDSLHPSLSELIANISFGYPIEEYSSESDYSDLHFKKDILSDAFRVVRREGQWYYRNNRAIYQEDAWIPIVNDVITGVVTSFDYGEVDLEAIALTVVFTERASHGVPAGDIDIDNRDLTFYGNQNPAYYVVEGYGETEFLRCNGCWFIRDQK